jgi:hypothetical protein
MVSMIKSPRRWFCVFAAVSLLSGVAAGGPSIDPIRPPKIDLKAPKEPTADDVKKILDAADTPPVVEEDPLKPTPQQAVVLNRLRKLLGPPAVPLEPEHAQRRFDLIADESESLERLSQADAMRVYALGVHLQALYGRLQRWPDDADNDRRLSRMRAAGRRLKSLEQPGAAALGDFWLTTVDLFEINHSELSVEDRRGQARQLLRNYIDRYNAGPTVDAAKAALKQLTPPDPNGPAFTIVEKKTGDDGVTLATIKSPFQPGDSALRILTPKKRDDGKAPAILLVLPADAAADAELGDGFDEIKKLDLHNKYNLIVVAPAIAQAPWFADHPKDPLVRQDSYLTRAVVPAVDEIISADKPRPRFVIGFSKSGFGALSALLRHPDLFRAAAVFDAPLTHDKMDLPGMDAVFATQENFDQYAPAAQLNKRAAALGKNKRIALLGYAAYHDDMTKTHELLDQLHLTHDFIDGPERKATWTSGWLEPALESLTNMPAE